MTFFWQDCDQRLCIRATQEGNQNTNHLTQLLNG